MNKNRNQLVGISLKNSLEKLFIGKYNGRKEGDLPIKNKAFVFVINGVFECHNRLIESRTGLLLSDVEKIEFEGLGPENIILIIEL